MRHIKVNKGCGVYVHKADKKNKNELEERK